MRSELDVVEIGEIDGKMLMKEIKILGIVCLLYASALILALPSVEVGVQAPR